MTGNGHIAGPDIELPFAQSQQAADNGTAVNADPHVHVHLMVISAGKFLVKLQAALNQRD